MSSSPRRPSASWDEGGVDAAVISIRRGWDPGVDPMCVVAVPHASWPVRHHGGVAIWNGPEVPARGWRAGGQRSRHARPALTGFLQEPQRGWLEDVARSTALGLLRTRRRSSDRHAGD